VTQQAVERALGKLLTGENFRSFGCPGLRSSASTTTSTSGSMARGAGLEVVDLPLLVLDRQLEADIQAGKLDRFLEEARREHAKGKTPPL
jgi:hypothetical protein